jgi:outer membrane protein assembly factor BamB
MKRYALLCALAAGPALAADWPQFRGPDSSAISQETGLPVKWGATENVRWKVDLPGRGVSCPVIAGGKIYVSACSGYRQKWLHVLCLDVSTGAKLWEREFKATGPTACHPISNMAAPTPATDGKNVYALFATGDLVALDADGRLLWYRSLSLDYGNLMNQIGLAASPVLAGKTLLVPMGNAGNSYAAGIDVRTGQNKWKVERARDVNWATPLVINVGGRVDAVFPGTKDVTAYDPETGAVRWTYTGITPSDVASPARGEGGVVIVPGDTELFALRPGAEGTMPEVVWHTGKAKPDFASPIVYRGRVYSVGTVSIDCVDAKTGNQLWKERLKGKHFWASPILAEGKLYVVSEDGFTNVIKLGDKPEVLAANALGETTLATPAVAGGCLYLRSDQHLFCIGSKQ